MRKLAVSLSKGGVGKTTTAVNLSVGLAFSGSRVLLVDCDTQGQASYMLGMQPETGLAELIADDCRPDDAIVLARENLWLLAGGRALAGAKRMIDRKDFGGEQTLREKLRPLEEQYDYVILDTAPGWDVMTVNVLFYADEVLAPVSLEVLTLRGLLDFIQSLGSIQRYHDTLTLRYILPTFLDRRVKKSTEILEQLNEHFSHQLCAPIRYSVRLSEAPGYGQTIFEYASGSTGVEDYKQLVERIIHDGKQKTDTTENSGHSRRSPR
jgi:chromosome partitioning protein